MTKIWISQEWKEFFQLNKSIFIVFEGLSFGKKMIKITDWSFKHIAQDYWGLILLLQLKEVYWIKENWIAKINKERKK